MTFLPLCVDVCNAGGATKCGVPGPTPPLLDIPTFINALERREIAAPARYQAMDL